MPKSLPESNFRSINKHTSAVFFGGKPMTVKITLPVAVIVGMFGTALDAQAAPLSVVDVAAPGTNCVFNTTPIPNVPPPPGDIGVARLQSRTYPGTAPAPAAGTMAYVYRVDLTAVKGVTAANCVTKLALKFGPVVKLPYSASGADVFVVTTGGLGSVKIASADHVGGTITFAFAAPICPGDTSYFFGLASKSVKPVAGKATVSFSLGGSTKTGDRVP
jgi:hypothetical protein